MLSDCVCVCVCEREREREAGGLFFQRKPVPSIYSTSSWQAPKQGRLPWRWADFRIESLFGCAKHPAVCRDPSVLFLSALTRELWLSPWAPQWCSSGWSRWRMLFLPGVAMAAWASSCGDVAVRMLPCSTSASGSLRAPKPRTASALALPWLFQSRWSRSSTVCCPPRLIEASQVVLVVKNLPANARGVRDTGLIPGREDPLEEGMATHSSIPVWRILWTEEPGGLQSVGLHRVGCDWSDLACTQVYAAAAAKSHQSCPTLCDPIDGSPPGFRPWDSPGKNTGVGCHFLLQSMKVKSRSVVSDSSWPHGLQPTRLLRPWDFPGKSTGVGCHCLLRHRFIAVSKLKPKLCLLIWFPRQTPKVVYSGFPRVKGRRDDCVSCWSLDVVRCTVRRWPSQLSDWIAHMTPALLWSAHMPHSPKHISRLGVKHEKQSSNIFWTSK